MGVAMIYSRGPPRAAAETRARGASALYARSECALCAELVPNECVGRHKPPLRRGPLRQHINYVLMLRCYILHAIAKMFYLRESCSFHSQQ